MTQPFSGIRVIDATQLIAGPFASYQLAVLGADVIKVENPHSPDYFRVSGNDEELNERNLGTDFHAQSSNKRSITVDLKTEGGRAVFKKLVSTADVLIENYRSGAFDKLGLGYEELKQINARLIYCSVTAFGEIGPRKEHTGYDSILQAASGIMYSAGAPGMTPLKLGPPAIDYGTGMVGSFAIASALFQRERTGKGQRIDVSMLDVAMMLYSNSVVDYLRTGRQPKAIGNRNMYATGGAYQTKDGLLMIGALSIRQQRRLWLVLNRPELIKQTNAERLADHENEAATLADILSQKAAAEWEDYFQSRHIPAARVRTLAEAAADALTAERPFLHTFPPEGKDSKPVTVTVAPFRFEHGGPSVQMRPAEMGTHTDEVLGSIGYSSQDIRKLRAEKAI